MFKRLFFDIETSLIKGYFWHLGKQVVGPEQVAEEAKIICIAYKWQHEKTVKVLDWTDPDMLAKFALILDEADEIVGHNGKNFDMKWVMWEMLKQRIPAFPTYKVVDTLAMMRRKFRAPSNRLNYLCKVLFGKEKTETGGLNLWYAVMDGNKPALRQMISYCKNDVLLLEELYLLIESYFPPSTHVAVLEGGKNWHCPYCAGTEVKLSKTRASTVGTIRRQMQCKCGRYFTISDSAYTKFLEEN